MTWKLKVRTNSPFLVSLCRTRNTPAGTLTTLAPKNVNDLKVEGEDELSLPCLALSHQEQPSRRANNLGTQNLNDLKVEGEDELSLPRLALSHQEHPVPGHRAAHNVY